MQPFQDFWSFLEEMMIDCVSKVITAFHFFKVLNNEDKINNSYQND